MTLQSQFPYRSSQINERWSEQWSSSTLSLKQFVDSPSRTPKGCELGSKARASINRLRTGTGRTEHFLRKIGGDPSPNCDCGGPQTTSHNVDDCGLRGLQAPRRSPTPDRPRRSNSQLALNGSPTVIWDSHERRGYDSSQENTAIKVGATPWPHPWGSCGLPCRQRGRGRRGR